MKTPEQMAEEYSDPIIQKANRQYKGWWQENGPWWIGRAFLDGYQAAKDELAASDKVMDFNKGNLAKMEKVNMKFAYDSFPVTDKQAQDVKQIRENFSLLTDVLTQLVPNGRYLSIVQTKLEEACMFAVKGITHQAGDYGNLQNKA